MRTDECERARDYEIGPMRQGRIRPTTLRKGQRWLATIREEVQLRGKKTKPKREDCGKKVRQRVGKGRTC